MSVPTTTCCARSTTCALCRCGFKSREHAVDLMSNLSVAGQLPPGLRPFAEGGVYASQGCWDPDFSSVRARVASEWAALPKTADVISQPLKEKIAAVRAARGP